MTESKKSRLAGRLWRYFRRTAVFVLLIVLALSMLQERLIFPGAYFNLSPANSSELPSSWQLLKLRTASGSPIEAIFATADPADNRAAALPTTLVFFYGNGMRLDVCHDLIQDFHKLGFNVLVVEYVGFGHSQESPSEQGCYQAGEAGFHWLQTQSVVDPRRIIFAGTSLGSAVACEMSVRYPGTGLLMLSAFTSLPDAAAIHYPILPVKLLLKHHFNNLAKIGRAEGPIILGHGAKDEIVPAQMSEQLAKAGGSRLLRRFVNPLAGHNDLFFRDWNSIAQALSDLNDHLPVTAAGDSPRN